MPEEGVDLTPKEQLLTTDEIHRVGEPPSTVVPYNRLFLSLAICVMLTLLLGAEVFIRAHAPLFETACLSVLDWANLCCMSVCFHLCVLLGDL